MTGSREKPYISRMPDHSTLENAQPRSLRDLVALRSRPRPLLGWEALYRQMARMSALDAGAEVLEVGWSGVAPLKLLVDEFDVRATGVGRDAAEAEAIRANLILDGYADRADCREAPLDALPYKDGVFDLTIAGEQVAAAPHPETVIQELVRVTRPQGSIVLLQWVWRSPLSPEQRRAITDHLGVPPRSLAEWRDMLNRAGMMVDSADYRAEAVPGLGPGALVGPTLAETVAFRERLVLLKRALLRWGAEGVRELLARDRLVRTLLHNNAGVGLCMVRGIRPHPIDGPREHAVQQDDITLFAEPAVTGEPKAPPPRVAAHADFGSVGGSGSPIDSALPGLEEEVAGISPGVDPAKQAPHVEVEDLPLFAPDTRPN